MAESAQTTATQPDQNPKIRLRRRILLSILMMGIAASSTAWWFFSRDRVDTDNAYVMADIAIVSSRISGTISVLHVENDQRVEAGDLLVELDPRDYKAMVGKTRAGLERIEAEVQVAEVTIQLTDSQTQTQVEAAQAAVSAAQAKEREARHRLQECEQNRSAADADFEHTRRDLERYTNLYQQGAGSEQQRDRTHTTFKKAKAQLDAMDAHVSSARASLAVAAQETDRIKAIMETAKADRMKVEIEKRKLAALLARVGETRSELEIAELNLSYCAIRAPLPGYVAQKRIQNGERIQPGQPLLAVVPLSDVYVEANFKETQLEQVHLGQKASIKADIYPNHTYTGRVIGIRAGTGAAFSLLPPENATGNWIKVIQRVPVKIRLDAPPPSEYPLRIGSSLEVTIFTKDKSGPRLKM